MSLRAGLLVTCEHASGALPPGVDLGLTPEVLASHVSYDRGALEIARALAARTGAPLHLGRCTRLWVDLNRRETNPAVILERSYGVEVPGNQGLGAEAREARIAAWHRPYREAARRDAERLATLGRCVHLSIHSFDPSLDPEARAFDVGVLFDPARAPEAEHAAQIADGLAICGYATRLNEPYHGTPEGLTSWLRGGLSAARYTGLEIEASQAWVDNATAASFAADLAGVLRDKCLVGPLDPAA